MNGVVTTAPQLGRAAFDGTTGMQSLECAADGVPATSFAGICVMDLLDVHVVELEQHTHARVPPCSTTRTRVIS